MPPPGTSPTSAGCRRSASDTSRQTSFLVAAPVCALSPLSRSRRAALYIRPTEFSPPVDVAARRAAPTTVQMAPQRTEGVPAMRTTTTATTVRRAPAPRLASLPLWLTGGIAGVAAAAGPALYG